MNIYKEIYYKELAYAPMGADMSQDLQGESESWRPRGDTGIVLATRPAS